MHACMHACMHGWMDGWMDGCVDGWTDGWMHACLPACMYLCLSVGPSVCLSVCVYVCITCMYVYIIYIYMAVDLNSFFCKRPFFANRQVLSRIFRELHVCLSRNPCWATTPLMKISSSLAKSHQIITDNFFIALQTCCQHHGPFSNRLLLIRQFFARLTGPLPSKCTLNSNSRHAREFQDGHQLHHNLPWRVQPRPRWDCVGNANKKLAHHSGWSFNSLRSLRKAKRWKAQCLRQGWASLVARHRHVPTLAFMYLA